MALEEENDTTPTPVVTDEEVRVMKESMLSTSKSGIIMQDGDIRKILEAQKSSVANPPSTRTRCCSIRSQEPDSYHPSIRIETVT